MSPPHHCSLLSLPWKEEGGGGGEEGGGRRRATCPCCVCVTCLHSCVWLGGPVEELTYIQHCSICLCPSYAVSHYASVLLIYGRTVTIQSISCIPLFPW